MAEIISGKVVSAKAVGFGGIAESISYMCFGNKFGFKFDYSPELEDRMYAALGLWYNEEKRQKLIKKIMETDFSCKSSAVQYMEMYNRL